MRVRPIPLLFLACLVLFLQSRLSPAIALDHPPLDDRVGDQEAGQILTVSIPYRLFTALATYSECSEKEKSGENVDEEILPVLQIIIDELNRQYKAFSGFQDRSKAIDPGALQRRLGRLSNHIESFKKELTYRRKNLVLKELMERQKMMIQGGDP